MYAFSVATLLPIHDWNSLNETRNKRSSTTAHGVLTAYVSQMNLEMYIPFAIHCLVDHIIVGTYHIPDVELSQQFGQKKKTQERTQQTLPVVCHLFQLIKLDCTWFENTALRYFYRY